MREVQNIWETDRLPWGRLAGSLVAISLVFGVIFAFLGIYDTNGVPFLKRVVFWFATTFTGVVSACLALPLFPSSSLGKYGFWLRIIPIALLVSVPVTFVLTVFNPNFGLDSSFTFWLRQYGLVVPISVLVVGVGHVLLAYFRKLSLGDLGTENAGVLRQAEHPFFNRLPVGLRSAELYAVSAEDHYLRVHTSAGEELILMRLSDAIVELGNWRGSQVHRSWWVAEAGVQRVRSENGRKYLILKSNAEVPVSRTYSKAAKAAGLI